MYYALYTDTQEYASFMNSGFFDEKIQIFPIINDVGYLNFRFM